MEGMQKFIKTKNGKIILVSTVVAIVAVITAIVAVVALKTDTKEAYRVIGISDIHGTVKAEHKGNQYDAYKDMKLKEGYALTTEKESYVRMVLDGDKYIKLEEKSKAQFESLGKDKSGYTVINLQYGAITNEIAKALSEDDEYIVNTPNAVLAVRGTFFRVEVVKNEKGETLTDVYTYGGKVKSQRVLPSGKVVEEDVLIDGGYKATISMDVDDTVYITESLEEGKENTEPITLADIPEADIVDMYVASLNGHEMYVNTEELWNNIEDREIDVDKYTSNRDGEKVPVYDKEVSHTHTEKTVTKEVTCEEDGYTRVTCEVCGQLLSEVNVPATGHTEVTVTVPATDDTAGKTTVSCSVCGEILSEIEIPVDHVHTEETVTKEPTCTQKGSTVTKCSVCGEIFSQIEIPVKGHTEVEETVKATFASTGSYKKSCSVCKTTLETRTLDKLPAVYTDDGNIYITGAGYYTDTDNKMIPYTGDYVIAQKNSGKVECSIYIEGGNIKLTLDGINITGCLDISAEALVNLYGTTKENYITSENGVAAINNQATLQINSGNITATSSTYGLKSIDMCSIVGGNFTFQGNTADIKANAIYITGGSVKTVNNTLDGNAYNGATRLECEVYSSYPEDYQREFLSNEGGTQIYNIKKSEVNADGKYYIWKSAEDIIINERSFPDSAIRTYISNNYDQDYNGYLSDKEIEAAGKLTIGQNVTSFEGVQYLTNLRSIDCSLGVTATEIELRTLTKLEKLILIGAPITEIDTSKCTSLMQLNLEGTKISELDVTSNTQLTELILSKTNVSYIDISECAQLGYLNVDATKLSRLELPDSAEYIKEISCADTKINYLDLSACENLTTLNIRNCPMACINLEGTGVNASNFQSVSNTYEGGSAGGMVMPNLNDIMGMDITKVSNVTGADYDEMTGMLVLTGSTKVTYTYDCGNGISAEFAIMYY